MIQIGVCILSDCTRTFSPLLNLLNMKMVYNVIFLCLILILEVSAYERPKSKQKFTLQQADSLFTAQQWKSAIPVYEAVLKSEPNNALGWNRLGYCYHNVSEYDKALLNYSAYQTLKYPYFEPLNGPLSGLPLTTESSLPYPHHRGLWLGCQPLEVVRVSAGAEDPIGRIQSRAGSAGKPKRPRVQIVQ